MIKTLITKENKRYTLGVNNVFFIGFIPKNESKVHIAAYEVMLLDHGRLCQIYINKSDIEFVIKY